MKFRVTYWPGTGNVPSCCVKRMGETGELERIAKSYTMLAQNWEQAQSQTTYLMLGDKSSDGCLIEYVNKCMICGGQFYTNRDDGAQELCTECERDLTLA